MGAALRKRRRTAIPLRNSEPGGKTFSYFFFTDSSSLRKPFSALATVRSGPVSL